jgi:hypothetical protein
MSKYLDSMRGGVYYRTKGARRPDPATGPYIKNKRRKNMNHSSGKTVGGAPVSGSLNAAFHSLLSILPSNSPPPPPMGLLGITP